MISKTFSTLFSSIKNLYTKRPRASVFGALLVLVLVFFIVSNGKDTQTDTFTVVEKEFVQEVSASGRVTATKDVDLGFEQGGRVSNIAVSVGQEVAEGARLATLSLESLLAERASAEAEVLRILAENESTEDTLEKVTREENTKVVSALRTLFSDDLISIPESSSSTLTPPTITGVYLGANEGTYKFIVREKQSGTRYTLHVFDLESVSEKEINETRATPLGTRGLFVSFPDGIEEYTDTVWYVDIPNRKSTSYSTNLNAYEEAVRSRDTAISDARAELAQRESGATIAESQLKKARAELARIDALIAERSIRAPFAGTITDLPIEEGEAVSASATVVSMIGDQLFIESFIPEINISLIELNDSARVTLDAYGEEVEFNATVVRIDPAETIRDGVSNYKIEMVFNEVDERILAGMTANVRIMTEYRERALSIPQGFVKRENGRTFVSVQTGADTSEEREVVTGTISSSGEIEILSGLAPGEILKK